MKNIIIIIIITVIIFIPSTAHAIDSTPSADVKSKLEDLKLEIASKAAKIKQEITQKISNKAYIGTIASKTSTTLSITTKSGTASATITQDTVYSPQKFLKLGDFIAALGEVDETGLLHAKKIAFLPASPAGGPTILWGQIISITDDLATLKNREGKIGTISLKKIQENIKLNDFVIVVGFPNKNGILEARFIHIIPQGFVLKPKMATGSAQISTKSAKF